MVTSELDILIQARNQAQAALNEMKGQLEKLGGSFDSAGGSANKASGHMDGLMGKMKSLGGAVGSPISAVGGLVNVLGKLGLAAMGIQALAGAAKGLGQALGIGLNVDMENVTARLNAFTKDAAKSKEILADIRKEADQTPFAFNEMASATAGLMSSAKMANEPLMALVKTAEILAASNPAQGLEGAAFALREAVSGDFTSIIERFNLPRSYINKLKDEGIPALEAVRKAMLSMGFDADLVANMAKTASGRWSTLMDTFDGIRAKISEPLFDRLKSGLEAVQNWFDSNKSTIDTWAAYVAAGIDIVAGGIADLAGVFWQSLSGIAQTVTSIGMQIYEALQWLNPFASHSPPIVDQVEEGAAIITTSFKAIAGSVPALKSVAAAERDVTQALNQSGPAANTAKNNIAGFKTAVQDSKGRLDDLTGSLNHAKDALNRFSGMAIQGSKAFKDEFNAIQDQINQTELAIVNFQFKGAQYAAAHQDELHGLEAALTTLRARADRLRLQEAVQLDPLRRQLEDLKHPMEELPFEELAKGIKDSKTQIDDLTPEVNEANESYKDQQKALQGVTEASKGLSGAIPPIQAVSDAMKGAKEQVDEWKDKVGEARTNIETALGTVREFLQTNVVNPFIAVKDAVIVVSDALGGLKDRIQSLISPTIPEMADTWHNAMQKMKDSAQENMPPIEGQFHSLENSILTTSHTMDRQTSEWQKSLQKLDDANKHLTDSISNAWNSAGPPVTTFWNAFVAEAGKKLDLTTRLVDTGVGMIGDIIGGIGNRAMPPLVTGLASLIEVLAGSVDVTVHIVQGLAATLTAIFTGSLNRDLPDAMKKAGKQLKEDWQGIADDLVALTVSFGEALVGAVVGLMEGVWQAIKRGWQFISDELVGHSVVPELVDKIVEIMATLPGKLEQIGRDMIQGLLNGLGDIYEAVKQKLWDDGIGKAIAFVEGALQQGSPSKVMAEIGYNMVAGVVEGLTNGMPAVATALDEIFERFREWGGITLDEMEKFAESMGGIPVWVVQNFVREYGKLPSNIAEFNAWLDKNNFRDAEGRLWFPDKPVPPPPVGFTPGPAQYTKLLQQLGGYGGDMAGIYEPVVDVFESLMERLSQVTGEVDLAAMGGAADKAAKATTGIISNLNKLFGDIAGVDILGKMGSAAGSAAGTVKKLTDLLQNLDLSSAPGVETFLSLLGKAGKTFTEFSNKAEVVKQIQTLLAGFTEMGLAVPPELAASILDMAKNLGGPFYEAIKKLLEPGELSAKQQAINAFAKMLEGVGKTFDEFSMKAQIVSQIKDLIGGFTGLGLAIPPDLAASILDMAKNLGGPFYEAIVKLLNPPEETPAQKALAGMKAMIADFQLGQQLAAAAAGMLAAGLTLPQALLDMLAIVPREAGSYLDSVIKAILASAVPHLAMGTRNFAGGLALVGERGPELAILPRGAAVYPANETRAMLGTVITNNYYVASEIDIELVAYRVAQVLKERQ